MEDQCVTRKEHLKSKECHIITYGSGSGCSVLFIFINLPR